jgi:hypothetical protein
MIPIQFTLLLSVLLWLGSVALLCVATPSLADHQLSRLKYVERHLQKLASSTGTNRRHHHHRTRNKKPSQDTVIVLNNE